MKEHCNHAKNISGTDAHSHAEQSTSGQPKKWQTHDQQYGLDNLYEPQADQEDCMIEQGYLV
jgi:hypothetical protein